jgi:Phosphodiester glycosidase
MVRCHRQHSGGRPQVAVAAILSLACLVSASCSRAVSPTSAGSVIPEHGRASISGRDQPTTVVAPAATVPATSATTTVPLPPPPPIVGGWTVTSGTPQRPAVAARLVEIDAGRPGTPTISCLRIDPGLVRLQLITGTQEPDASQPASGAVPLADRASLLAAFNAGFKLSQSRGGWFSNGRLAVPLRAGAASLLLRSDGTADVGLWGRDVTMSPSVTAVRQNLQLLVDNGAPTALVTTPAYELVWGKTIHHQIAVWRSGIGITKDGLLVYVAGQALTVPQLAMGLFAAGAVRAMELDINTQFVDAYLYRPSPVGPVGTKLAASMRYGPEHYLTPQARDFVEVLAR